MRYILDDLGYVEAVSCTLIECEFKDSIEYKGLIPLGYYSLEEWATKGNIRAYKIVDGTFTYDPDRAAAIESEMRKGFYPSKYSLDEIIIGEWCGKPLYRKVLYIGTVTAQILDIQHGIENPDLVIDYKGRFTRPNTTTQNVIPATSYTDWQTWLYDFTPTSIRLRLSANQLNAGVENLYVTLEYTKTTDEVREEENFFEEPDLSIDANVPNEEPITPTFTMADYWIPYNNATIDGTANRVGLDAWISATNDDNYNALALEFTLTETHNLKAAFEFTGYEGCPRYQNAYIEKDGSILWDTEIDLGFESSGATFTRTINQVLEAGTYKLLIGSWSAMDFGIKCTEFSLSTEIPTNLFDLSSLTFPYTKDGLTFNYDDTNKVLSINGYSNNDFGLYIPCVIGAGNYTFSYSPIQTNYGFYFSIDSWGETALNGWGKNLKTFTATYDTSQMILWFDAGYTYDNMKLKLNLVKND